MINLSNKIAKFFRGLIFFSTINVMASGFVLAGSVEYKYDTLGRVMKASYANGLEVTYSYDSNGNRTGRTVAGGLTPEVSTTSPAVNVVIDYLLSN